MGKHAGRGPRRHPGAGPKRGGHAGNADDGQRGDGLWDGAGRGERDGSGRRPASCRHVQLLEPDRLQRGPEPGEPGRADADPLDGGKIAFLRSVAAPPVPVNGCGQAVVAPVLTGGSLYAVTSGYLTKYNAGTGRISWRRNPDPTFTQLYMALAVAVVLGVLAEVDSWSA